MLPIIDGIVQVSEEEAILVFPVMDNTIQVLHDAESQDYSFGFWTGFRFESKHTEKLPFGY